MDYTLIGLLRNSVERFPDKIAVVHGDKSLSYGELWKQASGLAHYFVTNGISTGDRVSLLIDNSIEYIVTYYAVLLAGGTVVSLNSEAKARDLVNWIEHSDSSFFVTQCKHYELPAIIPALANTKIHILIFGKDDEYSNLNHLVDIPSSDHPPALPASFDSKCQLASIIYTSGTTGHPKGVMLSHHNLYSNIVSIITYLHLTENDSIVNVLPFYYSYGNSVLHTHLAAAGTIFLENSMMYPQKIMSSMAERKVTGFSGVPSAFNLILSRTKINEFDLSSLRYMTQAGGPMAPISIERVMKELPDVKFFVMYGQTEASARLSYLPADKLESKVGSIGIAIPGVELKVMDSNHQPLHPFETGEIYARGDNIMLGYWKDPVATHKVLYNDWLMTGDLAYQDEDGYFYIVGRSSEMIKSGAHRISPKDIEEVIIQLDGVEEVAVVGVADELLGQVIKAVIVTSPGANLDYKAVMFHCKSNLANYKLPKTIEFSTKIPRTASGKVRRFMLQDKTGE